MVWFDDTDAPFASAALSETNLWRNIRDGAQLPDLKRPTVGFRVKKHFKSPTKPLRSEFRPGMQGEVIYRKGTGVYVHVQDLFDANGDHLKDWIHPDFIDIGTELYGNWKMDVCNIPRAPSKFTPEERTLFNDPKCKHLALGISTFLRKLAETNPDCLMEADLKRLGGLSGDKVPWITAKVLAGVKKAGLLGVLNNPQFTMEELEANANLDCELSVAQNEAGLYFRRYIGLEYESGQSKKPLSLYVGQTVDFYNRCMSWATSGHEELKDKSESVEMRALCRLELVFYKEHNYIIEQLFTSLLQTYKQDLLDKTTNLKDLQNSFHTKNCSDMDKIATASANDSKWTGAVQRKSFWDRSFSTCAGLNHQSPISEAPLHEPNTWLESHGYMADPDNPGNGKSIPISNFTCQSPKRMTVIEPGTKSASQSRWFIVFDLKAQEKKDYCFRITQVLPDDFSSESVDWPTEGSSYNITIEVRTDWKPHPFSWARLPLVGPFKDWDRANSWAINISWVDPSGQDRVKYFHCVRPYMMLNEESNGSIQPYARGIEVIHWLYRENIPADKQPRWIQTPPLGKDYFGQV